MTTASSGAGGNIYNSEEMYACTLNVFIVFTNDQLPYPYRYVGLQVGYKIMGIFLLIILGWKAKRIQEYDLEKKPKI